MANKPVNETPSRNEDEYFAKLDKERDQAERKSHYMRCPKCGATLVEETHAQVKVDICPECKGMWLDAGEMELMHTVHKAAGSHNMFKGLLDMFPGRARGATRK